MQRRRNLYEYLGGADGLKWCPKMAVPIWFICLTILVIAKVWFPELFTFVINKPQDYLGFLALSTVMTFVVVWLVYARLDLRFNDRDIYN
jgi:hypothetical protein